MAVITPIHPGLILQDKMEERDISQTAFWMNLQNNWELSQIKPLERKSKRSRFMILSLSLDTFVFKPKSMPDFRVLENLPISTLLEVK